MRLPPPHLPTLVIMFALKSASAAVAVPTVAAKKSTAMRTWKAADNKVSVWTTQAATVAATALTALT